MEYRNPVRKSATTIDCEINHPQHGWIPFTCDPNDKGALIDVKELHTRIEAEAKPAAFIPPSPEELLAELAAEVRGQRNNILAEDVDPIASNTLRWGSLTDDSKTKLAAYRQALLDVPAQEGFPTDVVWPERSV